MGAAGGPLLCCKSLWSVSFCLPAPWLLPSWMQFTTVYLTVLSGAGEGWLHSSLGKVQPCWRQQSCSHLHHQRNWSFVLSSLQPQGVLLLACLIASLIKTWLAVSNMISPTEHLKLSQQLCVCMSCAHHELLKCMAQVQGAMNLSTLQLPRYCGCAGMFPCPTHH